MQRLCKYPAIGVDTGKRAISARASSIGGSKILERVSGAVARAPSLYLFTTLVAVRSWLAAAVVVWLLTRVGLASLRMRLSRPRSMIAFYVWANRIAHIGGDAKMMRATQIKELQHYVTMARFG